MWSNHNHRPHTIGALRWRHNGPDSVSNHQPYDCLLNRLFRRRSKKSWKLRVTGLCAGIHRGPVNSPHKWPVTRKMFPFDDVIMVGSDWRQEIYFGFTLTHWNVNIVIHNWLHSILICQNDNFGRRQWRKFRQNYDTPSSACSVQLQYFPHWSFCNYYGAGAVELKT